MSPEQAVKHFGSLRRVAMAAGVDPSTVSKWVSAGRIPWHRQLILEEASGGVLAADEAAKQKAASMVEDAMNAIEDCGEQVPCERCGRKPSFAVVWNIDGEEHVEYLCAECDEAEIESIERDLNDGQ